MLYKFLKFYFLFGNHSTFMITWRIAQWPRNSQFASFFEVFSNYIRYIQMSVCSSHIFVHLLNFHRYNFELQLGRDFVIRQRSHSQVVFLARKISITSSWIYKMATAFRSVIDVFKSAHRASVPAGNNHTYVSRNLQLRIHVMRKSRFITTMSFLPFLSQIPHLTFRWESWHSFDHRHMCNFILRTEEESTEWKRPRETIWLAQTIYERLQQNHLLFLSTDHEHL